MTEPPVAALPRTRAERAALAAAALALLALAASFAGPLGGARAALAVLAFSIAPGAAVLRLANARPLGAGLAVPLALALSGFVTGAVVTVALYAGFGPLAAGRLVLALAAGAILWAVFADPRAGLAAAARAAPSERLGAPAVCAALVLTALVAWPIASSNRVRASIHGMLHASILYSAVDRGVPPENPFFAGEPLRYYWTWHVAAAAACAVGDLEPTAVFAAGNVATTFAFALLLGRLAADLAPGAGLLGVLLGFLGLNPFGALAFLRRDPPPGFQPLERIAAGDDPILYLQALQLGGDERVTATLTKFFNASSFPAAFTLLIAAWVLLLRLANAPGFALGLLAALALGGSIALSPITGLVAGLALGSAAALLWWRARLRKDPAARGLGAAVLALAASLPLAVPFVLLGGGNSEGTIGLAPTREQFERVALNLGPMLLLALPAAALVLRRGSAGARLLVVSAVPLLAMGAVLWFPVESQYKIVRMGAPLLGALAAAALLRRPAILGLAAVLCCIPTNAIAWNCYREHAKAKLPFHGEGTRVALDAGSAPIAELYDWIRTRTPPDSVILVDPRWKKRNFAGPNHGDEVPVLAHRPIWTDVRFYMNDYEPEQPARFHLVERLYAGEALAEGELAALRALRRPVYALVRAPEGASVGRILGTLQQSGAWQKVHSTADAYLFELRR